jgi:hypothetical protein
MKLIRPVGRKARALAGLAVVSRRPCPQRHMPQTQQPPNSNSPAPSRVVPPVPQSARGLAGGAEIPTSWARAGWPDTITRHSRTTPPRSWR